MQLFSFKIMLTSTCFHPLLNNYLYNSKDVRQSRNILKCTFIDTYLNVFLEFPLHADTLLILDWSGSADLGTWFRCEGLAGVEHLQVFLNRFEGKWIVHELNVGVFVHEDKILRCVVVANVVGAVEQVNGWSFHLKRTTHRIFQTYL